MCVFVQCVCVTHAEVNESEGDSDGGVCSNDPS